MGILVNHKGWELISERVPPDEIAERMRMPPGEVEDVLKGERMPDATFIAASLNAFPMQFHDLFTVRSLV